MTPYLTLCLFSASTPLSISETCFGFRTSLVVMQSQLLASAICPTGLSIFGEGLTRSDPSVCGAPEQMRCRSPSGYLQWNAAPDGSRGKHIPPARAPLLSSSSRLSPSSSHEDHPASLSSSHTHTHLLQANLPFACPCGMFAPRNSLSCDVFG